MSEDPSGNTSQFQAFAQRDEPAPAKRSPLLLVIAIAGAAIVVFLVFYLLMT
jgi:hypothetical protein